MNTINKCLFPVAGYGTRFLPATKAIPKEMLPILTKPLIQYGAEKAFDKVMILPINLFLVNEQVDYITSHMQKNI